MINQYAGTCAACRKHVPAQGGQRVNSDGAWRTFHSECVPVPVAPRAGSHDGWHLGPMVAFDVETTSPQPHDARMIQAALCHSDGSTRTWLIDPKVPIPPDATERHGITDAQVRAHGRPAARALAEIGAAINDHIAAGVPIVAFYASFDLTTLHAELARHALPPLDFAKILVVDPFILHKQAEPYWRGRKTLTDLCAYYQVSLEHAHDAAADATATLGVARAIAARHERLATMSLPALHQAQIEWFAQDSRSLQRYYENKGVERAISTEWPLETTRRG